MTYLFVAHDLSMVKHISDRVAVLYLGTLVELTTSAKLYDNPLHPYTQALLSAIPIPDPEIEKERDENKIRLEGGSAEPHQYKARLQIQGKMQICDARLRTGNAASYGNRGRALCGLPPLCTGKRR